jgi:hypothetical protein
VRTVHKFQLERGGRVTSLMLPPGAVVLGVGLQGGTPHAWISVDTILTRMYPTHFVIVGTGEEVPEGFVPSYTFFEGDRAELVWHACLKVDPIGVRHA